MPKNKLILKEAKTTRFSFFQCFRILENIAILFAFLTDDMTFDSKTYKHIYLLSKPQEREAMESF